MAANKFVLQGSGVEVAYTIGANPAIPALVYTDGAFQKRFKPNQILSENTGLGEMVSVPLVLSIDSGGERFGFFCRLSMWRAARRPISTRSVSMKRSAAQIPFRAGLRLGGASK